MLLEGVGLSWLEQLLNEEELGQTRALIEALQRADAAVAEFDDDCTTVLREGKMLSDEILWIGLRNYQRATAMRNQLYHHLEMAGQRKILERLAKIEKDLAWLMEDAHGSQASP